MVAKKLTSEVIENRDSAGGGASGFFARMNGRTGEKPKSFVPLASSKAALELLHNFEESKRGWFWSTDSNGRVTYLSEAVCAALGKAIS